MPPRRSQLLKGTLDLIVLRRLHAGPMNGWDLTQAIEAVSSGTIRLNYGSLYPALRRLEARGLIKAKWETTDSGRRARFYRLTGTGSRALTEEQGEWRRFTRVMDLLLHSE